MIAYTFITNKDLRNPPSGSHSTFLFDKQSTTTRTWPRPSTLHGRAAAEEKKETTRTHRHSYELRVNEKCETLTDSSPSICTSSTTSSP